MKRLKGKIAIITGAAQGIGRKSAERFAEEGAVIVIVDINTEKGTECEQDLIGRGFDTVFIKTDISDASDVRRLVSVVKERYGRIDVLYNNASVYLPGYDGRVTDIVESDWNRIIAINLRGIYLLCKYSIPVMKANGGGAIINTASSAGAIGIPNCDAYTASKGATVALTRSMAVEYGPSGIRVNCIAPAGIETPMLASSNLCDSSFDEGTFLKLRTPLRRYGKAREIADLAVFLASNESSYINGAIIPADGGITICGDLSRVEG